MSNSQRYSAGARNIIQTETFVLEKNIAGQILLEQVDFLKFSTAKKQSLLFSSAKFQKINEIHAVTCGRVMISAQK